MFNNNNNKQLLLLLLLLLLWSMMILIIGYTCPPTIHFKFITKCDSLFYYKVRWSAIITKYDSFFITKCDKCYYKVRQVLQSATLNTVLSKVSFFSSQVFGFILVLRTRLAEFLLETNYLSDNSSKDKSEDEF